jgi:hypothetical protein
MRRYLLLLFLLIAPSAEAQVRQPRNALRGNLQDRIIPSPQSQESLRAAVREVESGLRRSSASTLEAYLAPTVQVALPDLGRGEYSTNQALQLLSGYFNRHPIRSVTIDRLDAAIAAPFAAGTVIATGAGRDTLRLYLSFSAIETRWLITHFSLY